MADKVDISSWNRKQHFDLYKDYSDPFFNMTANLNCSILSSFRSKIIFRFICATCT